MLAMRCLAVDYECRSTGAPCTTVFLKPAAEKQKPERRATLLSLRLPEHLQALQDLAPGGPGYFERFRKPRILTDGEGSPQIPFIVGSSNSALFRAHNLSVAAVVEFLYQTTAMGTIVLQLLPDMCMGQCLW